MQGIYSLEELVTIEYGPIIHMKGVNDDLSEQAKLSLKIKAQESYVNAKECLEEYGFELNKDIFYNEVVCKKRNYLEESYA